MPFSADITAASLVCNDHLDSSAIFCIWLTITPAITGRPRHQSVFRPMEIVPSASLTPQSHYQRCRRCRVPYRAKRLWL